MIYRLKETSFNPRTRVGCDLASDFIQRKKQGVSIHAPAWGATVSFGVSFPAYPVSIHAPAWGATSIAGQGIVSPSAFQSTHPRGVRRFYFIPPYGGNKFQSTHPRGVRPSCSPHGYSTHQCFNPRTRVGCDVMAHLISGDGSGFQSTHPRGVRRDTEDKDYIDYAFQSTHPRGVRLSFAFSTHC